MSSTELFPRSKNYDPQWVKENSIGGNVLFSIESLTKNLRFFEDETVLDLACGKCVSSIFLSKEFNCKVYAFDKDIDSKENLKRIKEMKLENRVFPIQDDIRFFSFPENMFDKIICVNSYTYFGTDDRFLGFIAQFMKQGGKLAFTDIGFTKEIETKNDIPELVAEDFYYWWQHIHSLEYWVNKIEKSGLFDVKVAEICPEQEEIKKAYLNYFPNPENEAFAKALSKDKEGLITFFNIVAVRNERPLFIEKF